ncbi:MAG: hypothetical protein ACK5Y2_07375 [Bdellovibrionales bacterium]
MNNFDVILVSSFGQLDALSVELGRLGLNVLLIDVTEKLGAWPLEDREGPFGVFHLEKTLGAWGELAAHGDLEVSCPDGFVIWTPEGPISLRGPLAAYQLQKRGWKRPEDRVQPQDAFSSAVLPWLARSLQSTRFFLWPESADQTSAVPLSAPMSIRFPTRASLDKRREWIESQGVTYWKDVEILDGVTQGLDSVVGLEVKGPLNGVIKTQALVWGLTSLETDHMSFRVREKVFGTDVRRPDWAWVRSRFQIGPAEETQDWPLHMALMGALGQPWTHSDFVILHRTVLQNQFDVWIRIPDSKRFHKNYLVQMQDEVSNLLKTRLPTLQIQAIHEPQEALYTSKELGPRPYSQFSDRMRLREVRNKTLYFDGPEVWEQYSFDHQVANQKKILDSILVDWRKKQSEEVK